MSPKFVLCYVLLWLGNGRFYSYPSGLLHWHVVKRTTASANGVIMKKHKLYTNPLSSWPYMYNQNKTTQTISQPYAYLIAYMYWKLSVVTMMPILSQLVVPQVVVTTTCGTTSYDKIGTTLTISFQWCIHICFFIMYRIGCHFRYGTYLMTLVE